MTSGGLMQLVAYGAQDVYLTANPQVTFFKQLYRRHSNFAMEAIEQTFNGVGNFGKRVQSTISRNGDLITKVYVQVTLPAIDGSIFGTATGGENSISWVPYLGQYLIDNVYVEIGGQQIDKHYGEWLHIWNELTLPVGKELAYLNMVNAYGGVALSPDGTCSTCQTEVSPEDVRALACVNPMISANGTDCVFANTTAFSPNLSTSSLSQSDSEPQTPGLNGCIPEQTLYIPLEFWFCRHAGLALPLIALQYHEVRINLEFNDLRNLCFDSTPALPNNHTIRDRVAAAGLVAASLYVDYIYLDTDERRKFAQVSHEYLIETLQYTGAESINSSSNKLKLNFNHPCKELVWVVQRDSYVSCDDAVVNPWKGQQPFNYSDWWDRSALESGYSVTRVEGMAGKNPVVTGLLQLNGHDRFQVREGRYFNEVQPYQHHTNVPAVGINVYSFALSPEQHQPSGTCNLSRIDNTTLLLTVSNNAVGYNLSSQVRVYATNYNVLRIMSGMGGLAYSN